MLPETVGELLAEGRARLKQAGIATAALDARLLLQHAARLRHEDLAAAPERLTGCGETYRRLIARREAHEPVSRILGAREFYGREFTIAPAVLDPRPDTETLVEEALSLLPPDGTVLDLGTGSGAIIVTLLAERASATGVATDLSASALDVARTNAARHGVLHRLKLVHGNWLAGVKGRFRLIVSNPPYIPHGEIAGLAAEVRRFDPPAALDGGPDGLFAYRRIAAEARPFLEPDGFLLVEIGAGQQDDVILIFQEARWRAHGARCDLAGHVRCLTFK